MLIIWWQRATAGAPPTDTPSTGGWQSGKVWEAYDFLGPRRRDLEAEREQLATEQPKTVKKELRRIARRVVASTPAAQFEALSAVMTAESLETQDAMIRAAMERLGRRYDAVMARLMQLEIAQLIAQRQEDQAVALLLMEM